jgi:hypothetical protein
MKKRSAEIAAEPQQYRCAIVHCNLGFIARDLFRLLECLNATKSVLAERYESSQVGADINDFSGSARQET